MAGINSLLFLKVLCDLERQKIETIPDNDFAQEASASNEQLSGNTMSQFFVKIYMQKEYGIGGSQGSKRYACQRCSCLFRRKRHLRLHLECQCNHKCLGCSECYANIHNLYNSLGEENPEPVKAFTCSTCPASFLTHAGLAIHEECHPQPGKVLECESCLLKFNTRLEFNRHQQTHVTLVRYNCKRCSKVFSTLTYLARHVRVKHKARTENLGNHFLLQPHEDSGNDDEYSDGGIGKDEEDTFVKEEGIEGKLSEAERRKVCGLCHEKLKSVLQLKVHVCTNFPSLDKLDELTSAQCPVCSETYSSLVALKLHCGAHLGDDPLTCTFCDKKLSSFRKAKEHFDFHGRSSCDKCGVLFRTKLALLLHHCGFTQRCLVCDKLFPTRTAFKRHQLVHPPPKDSGYKCTECKKVFAKESYFRAHQIKHTGKQPFCCSICDQKFLMYGPFKKHVAGHLASYPYECNFCGNKFSAARTLKAHLKGHFPPKSNCESDGPISDEDIPEEPMVSAKEEVSIEPFILPKEEVSVENFAPPKDEPLEEPLEERVIADEKQPEELTFPVNDECPAISGFSCHKCSKVVRQQYQLFIHLREDHGEAPPYLFHCDLCSRGFYHRLHLNSHKSYCSQKNAEEREQISRKMEQAKENSLDERKLKCPECGKKYFTQQHLDNHMYVHRDPSEYPYRCSVCGAGYIREYSLKQHLEKCNVTNSSVVQNLLKCKICGTNLIDEKRLKRHMEAHKRGWECPVCKEKFLSKKGLTRHKQKCTPENAKYKTFRKPKKAPTVYACPTCGRTFVLRDRYEAHVASHEGIKRFQCPTCFNKFMSINNFKRHKCKYEAQPADSKNVATS